jgi:hypothetical protein
MRTSTGRWLLYPAHIIIIMFPNINSAPRRLFTARKEVILSAGFVGSPFILMHSGIGDAKDPSRVGIKTSRRPSVGRNLSDHPLTSNLGLSTQRIRLKLLCEIPSLQPGCLGSGGKAELGHSSTLYSTSPGGRASKIVDRCLENMEIPLQDL